MTTPLDTIPEFAFPSMRFLLSGFGDEAVYLNPTIICRHDNKLYVAQESLGEFASLINSATASEARILTEELQNIKPSISANGHTMVNVDMLQGMRKANVALINRYLDHLESLRKG